MKSWRRDPIMGPASLHLSIPVPALRRRSHWTTSQHGRNKKDSDFCNSVWCDVGVTFLPKWGKMHQNGNKSQTKIEKREASGTVAVTAFWRTIRKTGNRYEKWISNFGTQRPLVRIQSSRPDKKEALNL